MRSKKSAGSPKRKNDKPFASDCSSETHHIVDKWCVALAVAVIELDKLRFEAGQSDRSEKSDDKLYVNDNDSNNDENNVIEMIFCFF
jgi:hypothetical protein